MFSYIHAILGNITVDITHKLYSFEFFFYMGSITQCQAGAPPPYALCTYAHDRRL